MEKHKAIPKGYLTVGELAKKVGVTVRTLQYYDKEGLLKPSAESEGGRRLYTDKDMVTLHQILSLKHLGFSLADIKKRLISLDTPAEVANALTIQATAIKQQIQGLTDILSELEALKEEVLQMQNVDFKKYAAIITNLQMKNENYWLIKYFDDKTLEHCRTNFDQKTALEITETSRQLIEKAVQLQNAGIAPESEESLKFAGEFWAMITKFTNGDMSLLPKLMEVGTLAESGNLKGADVCYRETYTKASRFIGRALEAYFHHLGLNPFAEITK